LKKEPAEFTGEEPPETRKKGGARVRRELTKVVKLRSNWLLLNTGGGTGSREHLPRCDVNRWKRGGNRKDKVRREVREERRGEKIAVTRPAESRAAAQVDPRREERRRKRAAEQTAETRIAVRIAGRPDYFIS